jgi:rSAM/selenodomain-associated transferase 1
MRAEAGVAPRWTLQVFARAPLAGQVKTRLIPQLGVQGATDLHRRLVVATLRRACAAAGAQVELWIAGDPLDAFVQDCARRFRVPVFEQCGADLGERMARALSQALSRPDRGTGCVLIGSDCPAQTIDDLQQAAAALRTHEVVVQPCRDGGYVLIGLARPQPQLFGAIEWGGPAVLQHTLQRAQSLHLAPYLLREVPDLDTAADLRLALEHGWIEP